MSRVQIGIKLSNGRTGLNSSMSQVLIGNDNVSVNHIYTRDINNEQIYTDFVMRSLNKSIDGTNSAILIMGSPENLRDEMYFGNDNNPGIVSQAISDAFQTDGCSSFISVFQPIKQQYSDLLSNTSTKLFSALKKEHANSTEEASVIIEQALSTVNRDEDLVIRFWFGNKSESFFDLAQLANINSSSVSLLSTSKTNYISSLIRSNTNITFLPIYNGQNYDVIAFADKVKKAAKNQRLLSGQENDGINKSVIKASITSSRRKKNHDWLKTPKDPKRIADFSDEIMPTPVITPHEEEKGQFLEKENAQLKGEIEMLKEQVKYLEDLSQENLHENETLQKKNTDLCISLTKVKGELNDTQNELARKEIKPQILIEYTNSVDIPYKSTNHILYGCSAICMFSSLLLFFVYVACFQI